MFELPTSAQKGPAGNTVTVPQEHLRTTGELEPQHWAFVHASIAAHLVLLQVSKYRSMNVSTMTDARVHSNYVIQTGEVPVRHSHEEYMDVSAPAQLL